MTSALGMPRSKFRNRTYSKGSSVIMSSGTALPASATAGATAGAEEVLLISKLVFTGLTNDAATNETITLNVNGNALPFHFPGIANRRRTFRKELHVHGNLVVQPGLSITAESSTATNSSVEVHYQRLATQEAIKQGYIQGRTMPGSASTNTVAATALTAGTAKNIVAGVAGQHIEVTGLIYTGHNFNAAEDSARLGFWDGSTGSFGDSGVIMRVYAMGTDPDYAPKFWVGDTQGCIQGPAGDGLYVDATVGLTNLYEVDYDNEASGPFVEGETLTFGGAGTARLVSLVDAGATGTITFQMISGAVPADDETISGGTSSATADVDGTPSDGGPTGDWVVFYQYVDSAEVADTTGKPGSSTRGSKFWVYTEATMRITGESMPWFGTYSFNYDTEASGPFVEGEVVVFTPSSEKGRLQRLVDNGTTGSMIVGVLTGGDAIEDGDTITGENSQTASVDGTVTTLAPPDVDLRILGHAGSGTSPENAVAPASMGIGVGDTSTLPVVGLHFMNSDAAGTPLEVSSTFADDSLDIRLTTSVVPSFTGLSVAAGAKRAQLAWGRMTGDIPTGTANISRFS